jgi:E3 ubiquitin-protein ligase UBR2
METDESDGSRNSDKNSILHSFYSDVIIASGITNHSIPNASQIDFLIKSNLLPFLRSVSLFFHFLTNVSPPPLLKDNTTHSLSPLEEYDILCQYLGLKSDLSVLHEASLRQLALNWSRHPRVALICNQNTETVTPIENPPKLIVQPHAINSLIELPNDYSDLINSVSQFTCPNSDGDDSRSPTICLVCGKYILIFINESIFKCNIFSNERHNTLFSIVLLSNGSRGNNGWRLYSS